MACKSFQFVLTILPDAEDIINVAILSLWLEMGCVDMSFFKIAHEDVGVRGCYPDSHGCTANLKVVLPIKLEVVERQDLG